LRSHPCRARSGSGRRPEHELHLPRPAEDKEVAAEGRYSLRFALFDAERAGRQIGLAVTNEAVVVCDGVFTVALEFDSKAFIGLDRWLEVAVRTNPTDSFTLLTPRQMLRPVPQALFALAADQASSVGSSGVNTASLVNGAVTSAKIQDGTVAAVDLSASLAQGTFWRLDGNAGIDPASQFVGDSRLHFGPMAGGLPGMSGPADASFGSRATTMVVSPVVNHPLHSPFAGQVLCIKPSSPRRHAPPVDRMDW